MNAGEKKRDKINVCLDERSNYSQTTISNKTTKVIWLFCTLFDLHVFYICDIKQFDVADFAQQRISQLFFKLCLHRN